MGYPDLMPVSGYSFTPQVIQQQDRSNHHLLGAALLGGGAAYGAYKLNLDIIKDSMSASAFEEAIRSGKKLDIKSLTGEERGLLNKARLDSSILPDYKINGIFGEEGKLSFYDYLTDRYFSETNRIRTPKDLERLIEQKERALNPEKSSHQSQTEKLNKRRPHLEELKNRSADLAKTEEDILKHQAEVQKAHRALEDKKAQRAGLSADEAKKLEVEIKKLENNLRDFNARLKKAVENRETITKRMEGLLKDANITKDTIEKMSNGAYKKVSELVDAFTLPNIKASGAAIETRTNFFNQCFNTAIDEHNATLKSRPNMDGLLEMKADLELVRAAEAGDGYVTKAMAKETYQKLGAEVGKGEGSITKAFEALGKKLPKGPESWKKAGLLGGVVALGLYCFNS